MTDNEDRNGTAAAPPAENDSSTRAGPGKGRSPQAGHTAEPDGKASKQSQISSSRGFPNWLNANNLSLAFTSYQTGQLFLVGLMKDRKLSVHQSHFTRAMGIHAQANRIHVASNVNIWRLENVLRAGQRANEHYDRFFMPRNAQYTGDLDTHELGIDKDRRLIFVNTKFSCLATPSVTHSFRPIWKPSFISKLVPEDRCHLNGLAMQDGRPRYVTAISRSDSVTGWRDRRGEGGIIIDVESNEIVVDDLSMPHSPRIHNGAIWVLDSGRGFLVRIDAETRTRTDIAFCPGFLRGLAFAGRYAVVTTSLPRDGVFKDLQLQKNLESRDSDAKCGIYVVDVQSGGIIEWIEIKGHIKELFDVAVLPGVRCPWSVPLRSPQIAAFLTIEKGNLQLN